MKTSKLILLFCSTLLLLLSTTEAQQTIDTTFQSPKAPSEVLQVAKDAWEGQYLRIASLTPARCGFGPGDTVQKAILGEPFKIFAIDGKGLFKDSPAKTIKSIIQREKKWNVPIMLNGEVRAIIRIVYDKEHWTFYQFGMSNWATAMRKIYKTWPQSKGYHPIFISALHHFYFSVPEIDSINLTPVFKPKSETSISDTSEITAQTKLSNPDTLGEDYSKLEKIQDHVASLQQIYGMKGVKRPDLKGKGR